MLDLGQQSNVAAPDRGAGGVLDAEHDPDRARIRSAFSWSSRNGRRARGRTGGRPPPVPGRAAAGTRGDPGAQVPGQVEQDQLPVGRPAAAVSCPAGMVFFTYGAAVAFLVEHAGDAVTAAGRFGCRGQADVDADAVRWAIMLRCLRHSRHAPLRSTAIIRPHAAHVPTGYLSRHAGSLAQPAVGAGHAPRRSSPGTKSMTTFAPARPSMPGSAGPARGCGSGRTARRCSNQRSSRIRGTAAG